MVMVEARLNAAKQDGQSADRLLIDELVSLVRSDASLDDAAFAELEVRAGGRGELIAMMLEAALQSMQRTKPIAHEGVKESRQFDQAFDKRLAVLQESQSRTRAMIEDLVNGG